jgi:hypothetical protein
MTKTRFGRMSTAIGFLLSSSLLLTGCPGDCWGTADISVTVDESLHVDSGAPILVAEVSRIEDADVTGTSPEGLPIGPRAATPTILPVTIDSATAVGHAHDDLTVPYPTWYYAFVDLNDNGRLDPGEPFGTESHNPNNPAGTCGDFRGSILIDRPFR